MALHLDKFKDKGLVSNPIPSQPEQTEIKPVSSQPIDMTGETQIIDESESKQPIEDSSVEESATAGIKGLSVERTSEEEEKVTYTIKKGDTLWAVAKQQLVDSGVEKPSNNQIINAMSSIAKANDCSTIEQCRKKYFNHIGSQLDLTGLFGTKEKKSKQVQQDAPSETQSKPAGSVSKSEMEVLAEKISKENNIEGDFEEIIAVLKGKEENKLTSDQKKLLALYDEKNSDDKFVTIAQQVFESKIFEKSPKEQLSMLAKMYLSGDKEYEAMSAEDKQVKFVQTQKLIAQLARTDVYSNQTKGVQNQANLTRAIVLIGITKKQGISLEQIKEMGENSKNNLIKDAEAKIVNKTIELVMKNFDNEDTKKLSGKKKFEKYADAIISLMDKDYNNMTGKAKEKRREEFINKIASNLGYDDFKYSEVGDPMFSKLMTDIESIVSYSKSHNDTIIEVINNYPKKKLDIQKDYVDKFKEPLTLEQKKTRDIVYCRYYVLKDLKEKPSNQDVLDRINQLLDDCENNNNNKLRGSEIDQLKRWQNSLNKQIKLLGPDAGFKYFETHKERAILMGIDYDSQKHIASYFGGMTKENFASEEMLERSKVYLANASEKDIINYVAYCHKLGIPDDVIYKKIGKLLPENQLEILASYIDKDDVEAFDDVITIGSKAGLDSSTKNILREVPGWKGEISSNKAIAGYLDIVSDNTSSINALYTGMYKYKSNKDIVDVTTLAGKSENISDFGKANIYKSAVEMAPDDNTKLYMGRELSSRTSNAAALEGLAAASNSIQDQNIKSQYNSHIETAAEKLPPEQQQTVKTALQTGEISKETQAKTSIPAESKSAAKAESSAQKTGSAQTSAKESTKTKAQGTSAQTSQSSQQKSTATTNPVKTQAPTKGTGNVTGSSSRQTILNGGNSPRSTSSNSVASTENSTNKANSTNNSTSTDSTSKTGINPAVSVSESEKLKADAMAYAKEVADEIRQATELWEKTHPQTTEDDIETIAMAAAIETAANAVESQEIDKATKYELIERISNATNPDEIYEILLSKNIDVSPVKTRVLDIIANSATTSSVRNIVLEIIDDDTTVKELYKRTTSSSVKKELLNLMSTDSIINLLENKVINIINDVDYDILKTFLNRNMGSMTAWEFSRYLEYFDDMDKKALEREYDSKLGKKPTEQPNQVPPAQDQAVVIAQKTERTTPQNQEKGDMKRILADGTEQTRQGTGFGPVSGNESDKMYRDVTPDEQGAPIGMNDDVLTPGSAEWNRKYNKNNVPPPAFTMAALEKYNDNDKDNDKEYKIAGGYPPQRVPPWKLGHNKKRKLV